MSDLSYVLFVEAIDRVGLLRDILNVISGHGCNIKQIYGTTHGGRAFNYFLLHPCPNFDKIVKELYKVEGMLHVKYLALSRKLFECIGMEFHSLRTAIDRFIEILGLRHGVAVIHRLGMEHGQVIAEYIIEGYQEKLQSIKDFLDVCIALIKTLGLVKNVEIVSVGEETITLRVEDPFHSTYVRGLIAGMVSKYFNKLYSSIEEYVIDNVYVVKIVPYLA